MAGMELSDHGYEVLLQYLSPADTAALRCVSRSWQVCEGLKGLLLTLSQRHKLCRLPSKGTASLGPSVEC